MKADAPTFRVLVVDDEAAARDMITDCLRDAGHEVTVVSSGRAALDVLAEAEPSILITDWLMPGIDGLQLCELARANDALRFLYVVVLTVQSQPHHLVQAMEAGADDFITKPFDRDELLARVRNGCRFLHMQTELSKRTQEAIRYAAELSVLNARLRRAASTDHLTGLLNRREIMARMKMSWADAVRHEYPMTCIMCDIDRFKQINDSYGHDAGDEVLVAVAELLRGNVRHTDLVARIGGEEFLVLCPKTTMEDACEVAEMLREAAAALEVRVGDRVVSVTLSQGVAERTANMPSEQILLKHADMALYRAKNRGRDVVVCA